MRDPALNCPGSGQRTGGRAVIADIEIVDRTGSGGVGNYNLSKAPSIANIPSEAMSTITASLDDVAVGIAHAPVLGADNIAVQLVPAPT